MRKGDDAQASAASSINLDGQLFLQARQCKMCSAEPPPVIAVVQAVEHTEHIFENQMCLGESESLPALAMAMPFA